MGFEHGTLCVTCVFAFSEEMKLSRDVQSVRFVMTEKYFIVDSSETNRAKFEKTVKAALNKAGLRLGKVFTLSSVMAYG
jgi:hypothetical protein